MDFYIGTFEVTQEEWQAVMNDNPSLYRGAKNQVHSIEWYNAVQYCNKRSQMEGLTPCSSGTGHQIACNFTANGYRLPTVAEWKYASKGGQQHRHYKFSGSNDVDEVAWHLNNSGRRPQPVGQKKEKTK
jgi:sulfatase modifying factor 1